jgi:hypothetical protein
MQKQGWDSTLVNDDDKGDREKNRVIRVRQRAIGRELRRMYDGVVKEPVPEEFLSLLQKMDVHEGDEDDEETPEER